MISNYYVMNLGTYFSAGVGAFGCFGDTSRGVVYKVLIIRAKDEAFIRSIGRNGRLTGCRANISSLLIRGIIAGFLHIREIPHPNPGLLPITMSLFVIGLTREILMGFEFVSDPNQAL